MIFIILFQRPGIFGYRPKVHVSLRVIVPAIGIIIPRAAAWRCRPVLALRIQGRHQIPTEVYKLLVVRQIQLRILFPDPLVHIVHPLVVATPHGDGRMALQTLYLVGNLRAHFPQELGSGRIHPAGEHEIVPDQQAERVADFIEGVFLKLAATPEADYVHIGIAGRCQKVEVAFAGFEGGVGFTGDPVGALCENRLAVNLEGKVLPYLNGAQAYLLFELLPVCAHADIIEMLFSHPGRPPQSGVFDDETLLDGIGSRDQGDGLLLYLLSNGEGDSGFAPDGRCDLSPKRHRASALHGMVLGATQIVEPCDVHRNQFNLTGKSGIHALGAPVPATMVLWFADQVKMRHESHAAHRDRIRKFRIQFLRNGLRILKDALQHILAQVQERFHIPLPAPEIVAGRSHIMPVDTDVAERIHILGAEIHCLRRQHGIRNR